MMETIDDLRQQLISTADSFRFDHSRLDAATLVRAAHRRRRRRQRMMAVAAALAVVVTAAAAVTARERTRDSLAAVAPSEVYLVPAEAPGGFVLRRSTDFEPRLGWSFFQAVYRDAGNKRIAVASVSRAEAEATTTPPRATATPSGFWMSTSPQNGVEVDVATAGMSRAETETLFSLLAPEPERGESAYGLVRLPAGFRFVADERDTAITDGTTNLYAPADADVDGDSAQPRVSVFIGHTSKTAPAIDPFIYDERTTAKVRGRDVSVITHRAEGTRGDIVVVSWYEQPGLLVSIDTYNMTVVEAITFAKSLRPVTLDEWNAHRASARG